MHVPSSSATCLKDIDYFLNSGSIANERYASDKVTYFRRCVCFPIKACVSNRRIPRQISQYMLLFIACY